jgi:hypothetical protein
MKFLESATFDWMDLLSFYERPFRAKFVPAKIWKDMDKYKNDSKGLSDYARKWRTKIEFRAEKSKAKWTKNHVAIGGEYDPDSRQISIQIYTDDFKRFEFTLKSWDSFKYRFIQTMQHELVHFMQYDRRGDEWSNYVVAFKPHTREKKHNERKYLSEFDEIQAYAHCVLMDFKVNKPNVDVETLLGRAKKKRDSKTLHYFLKTFDYDYRNNEAIPKIMKQIMKWESKYRRIIKASKRPK